MKAIDTNILIRWIVRDDPKQSPIADLIMREPVFVSATVLQELFWVLSKKFDVPREDIVLILRGLLDIETVTVASEANVRWVVDRYAAGADFPDMLHIAVSSPATSFISFERHLAKLAGPLSPVPVERAI